jgi:hypothetical protein
MIGFITLEKNIDFIHLIYAVSNPSFQQGAGLDEIELSRWFLDRSDILPNFRNGHIHQHCPGIHLYHLRYNSIAWRQAEF